MEKNGEIIIIGAGLFGLSTACQLAKEGYSDITILDRHVPPVPDGSSNDISRVVRFDYGDEDYVRIASEAYLRWKTPKYNGIFHPAPYLPAGNNSTPSEQSWIAKTAASLAKQRISLDRLSRPSEAKERYPVLSGELANPGFFGYTHQQAGWADAHEAIAQLRDDCLELGVSFVCGHAGTVTGFDTDASGEIRAARTRSGAAVGGGDRFVLTAGAWTSGLVRTFNSTLSTAQVVGYVRLTPDEVERYRGLPIYTNVSTGWFNFPPHEDTMMLKMAVHGWGYTRDGRSLVAANASSPPLAPPRRRPNFVPADGEKRLRQGLREILPELGDRPFDKTVLCWYTDTPTGDFIMDYHPDHGNLLVGGGGSGHAFKFLPVLGEYMSRAFRREPPPQLAEKWRLRRDYEHLKDGFAGDGSRGGPLRRELQPQERAML